MGVFTSTKQFRLGLNLINPWWLSGASIDLDLDNGRYYDSSLSALKQPLAAVTDYLSCSRASVGYAKTSTGTLSQFGNNALRLTDLGLLIEDARTNVLSYSQDFSLWNNQQLSLISTTNIAPDGTSTATKGAAASLGVVSNRWTPSSVASGSATTSVYFKAAEFNFGFLQAVNAANTARYAIIVNLTTGAVTATNTTGSPGSPSSFVEMLGNGWVRASITLTDAASNIFVGPCDVATPTFSGANGPIIASADGTSGIYLWGAQVEAGAFPSSYIPTTGSSATRAADNITITGAAQTLIAAATASIVAQVNSEGAAGVAANLVDSNGTNLLGFDSSNHGLASITATLATSNAANRTSRDKVGLAWSGAGRSLVLNSGTVATDASAQTPSSTQHLGSSGSTNFLNGLYERLTIWNSKLADATLQALTAP